MAIVIDTLQAMKALTEGDTFTQEQAERIVDVISDASDDVATKADLKLLRTELRSDMEIVRRDLTIKMYAANLASAALVISVLRLVG